MAKPSPYIIRIIKKQFFSYHWLESEHLMWDSVYEDGVQYEANYLLVYLKLLNM